MNGYLSPLYAMSLAEFGRPVYLARSSGWLLRRPIPESAEHDAIGCYPLFNCLDWSSLGADLDELAALSVAVALVVDPFAQVDAAELHSRFPDVCRPFKEHAVVDFSRDLARLPFAGTTGATFARRPAVWKWNAATIRRTG